MPNPNEPEVIERALLHRFLDRQLDGWEERAGHGEVFIRVVKGRIALVEFHPSFKRHEMLALLSSEGA